MENRRRRWVRDFCFIHTVIRRVRKNGFPFLILVCVPVFREVFLTILANKTFGARRALILGSRRDTSVMPSYFIPTKGTLLLPVVRRRIRGMQD